MLKLIYEFRTMAGRWVEIEDTFTTGEKRTAVEIARSYQNKPNYRNVRLLDFSEVKGVVQVLDKPRLDLPHLHDATVRETISTMVPVAEAVSLKRLPAKPRTRKAVAKATAAHFRPAPIRKLAKV